jgi:hypothetical protein
VSDVPVEAVPAGVAPARDRAPARMKLDGSAHWLAAAALLVGALIAGSSLWGALAGHAALPYADQWTTVTAAEALRTGTWSLDLLWQPHNEHRIVLPRLLFLLDAWPFGGRGALLVAAIWTIQIAHAVLLVGLLRDATKLRATGLACAIGIAASLLFSALQIENLALGFQVQFVGVFCLATLSFVLIARPAGTGRQFGDAWFAAGVAATAASLTMAGGLLVWPILVLLAIWLRLPGGRIVALVAWGAAVWAAYLFQYQSPAQHPDPLAAAASPGRVLAYAACYVGHVLDRCVPLGALGLGAAGLVVTLGLAGRVLLGHPRARPAEVALLAVVAFSLACGLATSIGRLSEPLEQAMSSRYATAALVFWTALLFLMWSQGRHAGRYGRWPAVLFASGLLIAIIAAQPRNVRWFAEFGELRAIAATALMVGADDEETLRAAVHPMPRVLPRLDASLRRLGLSIYGDGRQDWIGRPVGDLFAEADARACNGAANLLAPIDAASFKAGGWAWDALASRPVGTVLLVDGEIGRAHV